jgi:ribosomal protein S17
MGCTEQIMFNEKVNRPYSYSKKNMILNIYKHVCDEHAELKVGDTVKIKRADVGIMCVLK